MKLEFKKFSDYNSGILYKQLVDAYSFDNRWKEQFNNDWVEYDTFFYNNLSMINNCGFITVLDGIPIGHISWDPRKKDTIIIGHNCIITKYKGLGYGKKQLQEAIDRIKENYNAKKIIVTTNENIGVAIYNYESVGFKLIQKRDNQECPFSGKYMDYEIVI